MEDVKRPPPTMVTVRARVNSENTEIAARFSAECMLSLLKQGNRHGPCLTNCKLALQEARCLMSHLTSFSKSLFCL